MENTQWLEWRKKGIGASDAPVIMGVSPWRTPYQLWEEKTGLIQVDNSNWATRRGNEFEPAARASFELATGLDMPPALVEHPTMPHLRASLDGMNEDSILEIKCPGKKDHDLASIGIVPEKYWPQIQHQFLVTGKLHGFYYSYDIETGTGVTVNVKPDVEYIEQLIVKENKFWAQVTSKIPPELTDRDAIEITDPVAVDAAKLYVEITNKIKSLEVEQEMLKKALIDKALHPRVTVGPVSITRSVRKGAVDYLQIKDIDFDKYRKPDTSYYMVKIK